MPPSSIISLSPGLTLGIITELHLSHNVLLIIMLILKLQFLPSLMPSSSSFSIMLISSSLVSSSLVSEEGLHQTPSHAMHICQLHSASWVTYKPSQDKVMQSDHGSIMKMHKKNSWRCWNDAMITMYNLLWQHHEDAQKDLRKRRWYLNRVEDIIET